MRHWIESKNNKEAVVVVVVVELAIATDLT
jgi:hypothetical protein